MAAKKPKLCSMSSPVSISTNWSVCSLCQENGGSTLVSPTESGYDTLSINWQHFNELGRLPLNISLQRLNDAKHAISSGNKRILIQATDTDVVVLGIAASSMLPEADIWIAFGHGATFLVTNYLRLLELKIPKGFCFFAHSRDAIQFWHSMELEKLQHGNCGKACHS